MDRPPDSTGQGFGICVKGGKEAGGGVYISRVEPGSVAERAGLRPGDSILQANGTPFRGITHEEALKMLKSCRTLSMTVESSPQSVQESIPMRQHPIPRIPPPSGCRYSWVDRVGRPVSPPPPVSVSTAGAPRSPPNRDGSIRKVEMSIEPGQSLGLMIRGGAEYDLGVFVTGVDEGSAAERAGLKVGDQILEVNGVSFLSLSHDEAVHRLKHPRRMTLTVRDVGRVPHSSSISGRSAFDSRFASGFPEPAPYLQTTSDEEEVAIAPEEEDEEEEEQRLLLPWCASALPSSSAVDGGGRGVLGCPSLQMVEEKARRVLRKSEFATLAYYMREYAARRMAIDAFLAVLLEMLSTPEKYTLLTELREVVALEDRARFDELVYRREAEGQRCRELRQMLMAGNQSNSASRGLLAPSGRRHSLSGAECCHGLLVDGDGDAGADDQDHGAYDDPNMCGYLDGIRSHLGDWTQRVKSWYWGRPPEQSQGGVFEGMAVGGDESTTGEETGAESGDGGRQQGGGRRPLLGGVGGNQGGDQSGSQQGDYADGENVGNSSVVTDQQGNLRITVRKTRPMLGIAIEGGANTKHPLPRIINIHEDGAAFEAGGLEVGQLILEVDGQKVEGLGHQEVARLIAESFARKSRPGIEFLVIEAKKSNLEPKPTALIFLET